MAKVQIKISLDKDDNPIYNYECDGFGGTSCDRIEDIMSLMGSVQNRKENDDAYAREIPIPVPNQVSEE